MGRPGDDRDQQHHAAPARIHAHEGICQFLFLQGSSPPEVSYADKAGKYMRQRGVSLPRL